MTTFYDHDGIRITERWLTIGGRGCPVDHLRNLRVAREPGDRIARRAAATAAVSLLVVAATVRYVPVPMSVVDGVVFVGLPALVAAVRARLVRPAYLLWADYRGTTVQLYRTRDETEFGKISRALARASARGPEVSTFIRSVTASPRRDDEVATGASARTDGSRPASGECARSAAR